MAVRKSEEELALQRKVKVMAKLFANGCRTESELQSLSMAAILKIQGITMDDLRIIMELQKSVKNRSLYSYLGGGEDEQPNQNE